MNFPLILLISILGECSCIDSSNKEIGCFVPGECQDSISIGVVQESTPEQCLDECKATDDCQYFSHYQDNAICILLLDCVELSDDNCVDCISGDVNCDILVCDEPGKNMFIGNKKLITHIKQTHIVNTLQDFVTESSKA